MHPHLTHSRDLGIVYKKTIGSYTVHTDGRMVHCEISPRLRKELIYPTADPHSLAHIVRDVRKIQTLDPVAVGDQVRFIDNQDGSGLILEVLPRRSQLVRAEATGDALRHARQQVIVANLDQVVPVFAAAQPAPSWRLLDRYLVSAESLALPALIVINKIDLIDKQSELMQAIDRYRQIGYPVLVTSAVGGQGIEALRQALAGKLSVLVGKSGVGKSSLLNAVQPGLGLRVAEISRATQKGRHTTTNLEMAPLDDGASGYVVDTPGMREFGLWQVDETDLALLFPEMRPYVGRCKFGLGCTHLEEPGCAVRKAVMENQVSPERYQSYSKLLTEG